jgi:hypothetical protein
MTLQLWDAVSSAHLNTLKGHSSPLNTLQGYSEPTTSASFSHYVSTISGSSGSNIQQWTTLVPVFILHPADHKHNMHYYYLNDE